MEATEYPANSLFRNILPLSPLNPKIWREFLPNPMIPLDRGRGGTPTQYQLVNSHQKPGLGKL
jgi:hypothetical protein